jgi:hypothetical protein
MSDLNSIYNIEFIYIISFYLFVSYMFFPFGNEANYWTLNECSGFLYSTNCLEMSSCSSDECISIKVFASLFLIFGILSLFKKIWYLRIFVFLLSLIVLIIQFKDISKIQKDQLVFNSGAYFLIFSNILFIVYFIIFYFSK